jgi:tRNA(fMet)-specific endonuclease VapC
VATLLDTTVFIDLERAVRRLPPDRAMTQVSGRLAEQVGPDEEAGIAAITASELLHGVHRAAREHRARREAFVEAVTAAANLRHFDRIVG